MSRGRTAIAIGLAWIVAVSLAGVAAAGSVPYLSGGVGSDERKELEERAAGYNLLVELADPSGEFEGGGRVAIRDGAGKPVLDTAIEGPQLYVKLPPGRYTVTVSEAGGKPKTATVEVPASGRARTVIDVGGR